MQDILGAFDPSFQEETRCNVEKLNDLTLRGDQRTGDDANNTTSSDASDSTATGLHRSSSVSGFTSSTHLLRRAEALISHSRPLEALELLRPIVARRPNDPDVLCLQASCLIASGNRPQALAAYATVLASDPCNLKALMGCAAIHKDSGLLQEAVEFLERAYSIMDKSCSNSCDDDDHGTIDDRHQGDDTLVASHIQSALAMVLTDLGTQLKLTNQIGWKEYYDRAVQIAPSYAPAHYNLGVAAAEGQDQSCQEAAINHYKRAIELEPRYPEAWCNLGVLYKSAGRLDDAINAYEMAYAAGPMIEMVQINLAAALTDKGTILKLEGKLEEGIKSYERALALRPRHAQALYNLGVAYTEAGQLDKATFMYEMAIAAAPQCAEAHNNLGVLHRERGNMEAACKCYEAALVARPNFPQGLNNLAVVFTQQGRAAEALHMLQAALLAKPDYAEAHNNLGVLQRDVGDAEAAVASYQRCCDIDPDNRNASQNRLLALNYIRGGESKDVCEAHAAWGRRFEQLHPPLWPPFGRPRGVVHPKRPLVVGYISPDLFLHSVSYFAEAPLRHHNPSRVHCIVYSVCTKPDSKTEYLAAAVTSNGGVWRNVSHLSEDELAQMIRNQDKVDILVELTGHTANNRLGTMARRPAPVQVTWIGYPNSTGLKTIDYRFTDAICDPVDTAQTFTEKLIRFPGCFLCYSPSPDAPPVAPLPALRNGFITFGSFNALAKQTLEVLSVWARILRSIPGSRLVLKNKPFACDVARQKFWSLFEAEGVARDRVDLLPLTVSTSDHLAQYRLVDICLDPWPYSGTTTTAEALYMGVPCLTLVGKCHAHNVGASLLTAVGLEKDWVARSVGDYVSKAQELSEDFKSLGVLRAGLRHRMLSSRLCDGPGFVSRLEDTYDTLWETYCTDSSPESP